MGAASSKIVEDKALILCRERRHFVRQALDGRCSLADAHVSYIEALRNTGVSLGKFFEPDVPVESSLYTSTSVTPEPLVLTDKSISQFSASPRSPSQHVEIPEANSPIPSPIGSSRINVNHMKSGRNNSTTVEERPPIIVTATIQSADVNPKASPLLNGTSTFDGSPMAPETPPWDYFGFFHPIDTQFSYEYDNAPGHGIENGVNVTKHREVSVIPKFEADDIKRLREVEGIPDLEDEGDKSSVNGKSEDVESEDDFDQSSTEPLVRIFKNRTEGMDLDSIDDSSDALPVNDGSTEINESHLVSIPISGASDNATARNVVAPRTEAVSSITMNGKSDAQKGTGPESKIAVKDISSSMKEIKELFIKASESGKQVPRMLEANKVNFRPLFPDCRAQKSNGSIFSAAFSCCREEAYGHEEPTTTDIKYLTWHHSVSSLSSSSQNLLGTATQDDADLFSSSCMNSGSHASTLDRLYAWEKKLYDEVKASGIVRKEYDLKCKLLRQQESECEHSNKTDKTRAKVKDLYSRVRVAIHRINSISKTIEDLRDKELQPQLEELIDGLSRMWTGMLECHKCQVAIMVMVRNNGATKISMRTESQCQAANMLEHELNFLCSSFMKWISAQRSYLSAINGWLLKCIPVIPTIRRRHSKKMKAEFCPVKYGGPPIYVTCRDWLQGLDKLPAKNVSEAIKSLVEETTCFIPQRKKKHGGKNSAHTFSRGISGNDEQSDPSDCNPGLDGLQLRLEVFLKGLQEFSDQSVKMYTDLREAIKKVRHTYETGRSM